MEKILIRNAFAKALHTYGDNADVQAHVADRMLQLVKSVGYGSAEVGMSGSSVLEIGCGTGNFTKDFLKEFVPDEMVLNDICPDVLTVVDSFTACKTEFVCGDAEELDFPEGRFGLVVSCSAIQWFSNPPVFMRKALGWLVPGGLLAIATYGRHNFEQIRQAAGVGLHYPGADEYVDAVKDAGEVLHLSEEVVVKTFPDALSVLKHLKYTGVNGIIRNRRMWTKGELAKFERNYPHTDDSGNFYLTYNPVYVIVRKNC